MECFPTFVAAAALAVACLLFTVSGVLVCCTVHCVAVPATSCAMLLLRMRWKGGESASPYLTNMLHPHVCGMTHSYVCHDSMMDGRHTDTRALRSMMAALWHYLFMMYVDILTNKL